MYVRRSIFSDHHLEIPTTPIIRVPHVGVPAWSKQDHANRPYKKIIRGRFGSFSRDRRTAKYESIIDLGRWRAKSSITRKSSRTRDRGLYRGRADDRLGNRPSKHRVASTSTSVIATKCFGQFSGSSSHVALANSPTRSARLVNADSATERWPSARNPLGVDRNVEADVDESAIPLETSVVCGLSKHEPRESSDRPPRPAHHSCLLSKRSVDRLFLLAGCWQCG